MSDKKDLKVERKQGYLWITLPNAITMYDIREIENKIFDQLADCKDHVVLDFSNTFVVYSSGLGLMIRIRRFLSERNRPMSLVNVSEQLFGMFTTLNLDKVFNIFRTDVEFEISQGDFRKKKTEDGKLGFLFFSKVEGGCYRINISGEMTGESDLSKCREMKPSENIRLYLFDLSGLVTIDDTGADTLFKLTEEIASNGGISRAFGASDIIRQSLILLGGDEYLTFFYDEKAAFEGNCPLS